MKTYAESQNKPPLDWNAELQKKIDDPSDLIPLRLSQWELLDMASEWVTCGVGNQCDAIPRHPIVGSPDDDVLCSLGMKFYFNVRGRDWRAAQATLAKIEARSAEILATL